ncbi:hypothetical protein [Streptomyces sp. B4I13]|uniref:hypothetical protein n=1 Tax=Streptomyces sp. B4I13 TaxID=3042271 RepID=UPI0027D79557|nr:hypothetical protein [Streptomyces sp. B4I13]
MKSTREKSSLKRLPPADAVMVASSVARVSPLKLPPKTVVWPLLRCTRRLALSSHSSSMTGSVSDG